VSPSDQASPGHAGAAAAAFVLLALATVAWGAAFSAINAGVRDEIEAKGQIHAMLERQVAARAKIGPGARSSRLQDVAAISAPTETVAASGLQKQILERLEATGGSVQSVQAEPVKDAAADGLRRLVAQLTFDSSIAGLQRLLFELETGVPFVFVDSITAQPATTSVPGTRPGDRLRVTLSVSSYWKQE
jgi:general secretion pathway protein M